LNSVNERKDKLKKIDFTNISLVGVIAILMILFSSLSPYFFTISNLITILLSVSIIGICALSQSMVVISGGIDLSQESVIASAGVLFALLNSYGLPISISIILAILSGVFFGFINGIVISKLKVNPLMVTLALMGIIRGINGAITKDLAVSIPREDLLFIKKGIVINEVQIPLSIVVFLAFFLIYLFILNSTIFGRRIYAVGGNELASLFAGVNVDRIKITAYIQSGALGAISGILYASITGAGYPYGTQGYIINILAAVFLGGISLEGGRGKISGTLLGVLIIGIISNGLRVLGVQTYIQNIIIGGAMLSAVAFNEYKLKKEL